MMKIGQIIFFIVAVALFACAPKKKEEVKQQTQNSQAAVQTPKVSFDSLSLAIFDVQTYDGDRILEKGKAFLVAPDILAAPFYLFESATRAQATPFQGGTPIEVTQYWIADRINGIILLKVNNLKLPLLKFYTNPTIQNVKTYIVGKKNGNTLPLMTGKCSQEKVVQGSKLFNISNVVDGLTRGMPVFVSTGAVLGMATFQDVVYERTYFAIPGNQIMELMGKKPASPKALKSFSDPNSERNSKIKKIILQTDYGDISIRLYNETPEYRDNFVKLVEQGFYDSLLFHRVIRDFGIQTGAADSRYALPDDPVGYRGPGYTLPAHIIPGLYHKRGAIGIPRKPDNENHERRADGSQFYIVTGRKYLDEELNEFEKKNNIKFTAEQREVYKTIGGAPHLDGTYTVFGEVVSGLDVADRMTNVATGNDYRPMKDIRLKKVIIEY
jgi:peptidyl-prolyl cis-trans isomerase A (cyclophilin A)